jgi:Metal binding domain of Ada
MKLYKLIGPDGKPYQSPDKGTLGGHKGHKGYGRLDCPSALSYIAKGYYVKHRVFFADEATAIAAGYRPCAVCMKERYVVWKQAVALTQDKKEALERYRELLGV